MSVMQPLPLPVSKSSAFSRPRSCSPIDVESTAEDLSASRKEASRTPSPCANERLSPGVDDRDVRDTETYTHRERFPPLPTFKTPLRFGVDSLISHHSSSKSTKDRLNSVSNYKSDALSININSAGHSPLNRAMQYSPGSDISDQHSPRSDVSSPMTSEHSPSPSEPSPPPAHVKSHSSSFSMDEILGKSPPSSTRHPDPSSPAYVPSPAHETRWPSSLAVNAGFPWLPSSRISPPPSKCETDR